MDTWLDPFNDLPSWDEMGAEIEAELIDGSLVVGRLKQYDTTPGPEELPLFRLKTTKRQLNWFDEVKRFRYL